MALQSITKISRGSLVRWIISVSLFGIVCFILLFLVTSTIIGMSVKEKCLVAKGKYEGDCTESLIATLQDEQNSLRERNHAIWALGQIGDERAKVVIEHYYTGTIPEREPYDKTLSQYEMKKALNLLDGGFNITHLVWNIKSVE